MSEPRRKRQGEGYGACDAEVEEARAELYREQAGGAAAGAGRREKLRPQCARDCSARSGPPGKGEALFRGEAERRNE